MDMIDMDTLELFATSTLDDLLKEAGFDQEVRSTFNNRISYMLERELKRDERIIYVNLDDLRQTMDPAMLAHIARKGSGCLEVFDRQLAVEAHRSLTIPRFGINHTGKKTLTEAFSDTQAYLGWLMERNPNGYMPIVIHRDDQLRFAPVIPGPKAMASGFFEQHKMLLLRMIDCLEPLSLVGYAVKEGARLQLDPELDRFSDEPGLQNATTWKMGPEKYGSRIVLGGQHVNGCVLLGQIWRMLQKRHPANQVRRLKYA